VSQRYLGSVFGSRPSAQGGYRRPYADLVGMSEIVAAIRSFDNLAHDWHAHCLRAGVFRGFRS
jgi:hypothetical protein